jgi:hypothetical protein
MNCGWMKMSIQSCSRVESASITQITHSIYSHEISEWWDFESLILVPGIGEKGPRLETLIKKSAQHGSDGNKESHAIECCGLVLLIFSGYLHK